MMRNSAISRVASMIRRSAPIVAGVLTAMAIALPATVGVDDELGAVCGTGGTNRERVRLQVEDVKTIWRILPAMGRAPELEEGGPADIIVFDGEFDPSRLAAAGNPDGSVPDKLTSVVCVRLADGTPFVYHGVDLSGAEFR